MRNWNKIDNYYSQLLSSVYEQPDEEGRIGLAKEAIEWAMKEIGNLTQYHRLLDLGSGEGYAQELLEPYGFEYTGCAWGHDVEVAQEKGRNVLQMDYNFLEFGDNSFDVGFSSHSLEHSPMPIMTLLEWRRVISDYLIVILPHPDWYKYRGRNHFSVSPEAQCLNMFEQSGWEMKAQKIHTKFGHPDYVSIGLTPDELWFLLRKSGG